MSSPFNEDATMETVMKNIYTSCDPDNSNLVSVSKIIDFITPYMLEDLSALESLKSALDPQGNNVCISSEQFYEIMNEWTKKIANSSDEDHDFNRTPSQLDVIDEKQLPYTQSTPRASFGQKLLSCEGLLNLSNVSSYSLSNSTQTSQTKENITVGVEKTILEEEIKRLEHHLSKITNEMIMVRLQLTATEEQNEMLHADLDRCKTRLHSEQQMIEHLQNDKRYNDELREELNSSKKKIEDLTKKLLQCEKDNHHLYGLIEQTEKENTNLEHRCEQLSRREQEAKKEIIDIKTELDLKDQEITTIIKINDEMKIKLNQQKDLIDQLTNENELLNHKKISLEKALRDNLSARRDSIVSQYKTCLADSSSFPNLDQSSEEECYFRIQEVDCKNFLCESLQSEISQVSFEKNNSNCVVTSLEHNEKPISLVDNNQNLNDNLAIYEKEINQLKLEDNNMQSKLDIVNEENAQLRSEIMKMKNKLLIVEQDIDNLITEKKDKEDRLIRIQEEKNHIENELKVLNTKNSLLKDENNNLLEDNKSINSILESKNKLLCNLNEKLLELKQEITNLHLENISKEKELCEFRNKFNFEAAFKNLQIELNDRNKEISDMKRTNEELKELLSKITNSNRELEKSLREANMNLKENEEKSKQMLILNENIEHTTNQVQLHIDQKNSMISELVELNKKFERNVIKLEKDLQTKIQEVTDLQECLKRDIEIKNIMWRDNKELDLKLKAQSDTNRKLMDELEIMKNKNKEVTEEYNDLLVKYDEELDNNKKLHKQLSIEKEEVDILKDKNIKGTEEYNNLLIKYNEEINNNKKLCEQMLTQKEELSSVISKYDEEISKNQKLNEQICQLSKDIESLRTDKDESKLEFEKNISYFEKINKNLESELEKMKIENENLKTELLEIEKKPKPERFFDVDITPSENGKNRSFEKQKLSIDRLKEKVECTMLQLKNERSNCERLRKVMNEEKIKLEEKYSNFQVDFEKTQVKNLLEQEALKNAIHSLSDKIKNQEEDYKKLEHLLNEKENIFSVKLSQLEQQNKHLLADLTSKDFIINNIFLENEANKNFLVNADRKSHEYSSKISACIYQMNEKEQKMQLLHTEITENRNKNLSLASKISDLEIQLEKTNKELYEKTKTNINLEEQNKYLQEMLSKSDDHKEKELMDIEQKLKTTYRHLQCSEMELNLIQKKMSDVKQEFDFISREICDRRSIILGARQELYCASSVTLKKWDDYLVDDDAYQHLLTIKQHEFTEERDGLLLLYDEIKFAVALLEILANKSPKSMEDTGYSISNILNADSNSPVRDGKTVKKFTLRPPRLLVSRPASPDSPSVDIDGADSVQVDDDISASKKYYINKTVDSDNYQYDVACNNEDSYVTASEELSFNQGQFELISEAGFPNISDAFLEKLGLHESSPKQILSKEETERVFTTFAIQIALDSKDIKERLQKQKDVCTEEYEKFLSMLKDISSRLRDHKCIGATDSINAVFVLLEDLKFFLKDITQSVGQFGILTCENRMMRCWNLVTNYMALLKQEVIKSELGRSFESHNQSNIRQDDLDNILRRRSQGVNDKIEKTCEKSIATKDDSKGGSSKFKYVPNGRTTIAVGVFLAFLILILVILVHWQCRMSVPENQVCVLDDFIKKIQVGHPPY